MISADIKTNLKQEEIKELVAVSYNFSLKYFLKTWNTIWNICMYFSFNPGSYTILLDIVH